MGGVSKNEIQYVLDHLRTHSDIVTGSRMLKDLLYNRHVQLCEFAQGVKVLILLPTSSSKLLLPPWRENVPMALAMVVPKREELSPELKLKSSNSPIPNHRGC